MFDWPGHTGSYCVDCFDPLSPEELKRTIHSEQPWCDACEFDHLIFEGWLEDFLKKLWLWQFRPIEEDLGYN